MSSSNQNVTLPPIKHVFQGLFSANNNQQQQQQTNKNHTRSSSSSGGYPSLESNALEAARSLQHLSSSSHAITDVSPCHYCPPQRLTCCSTSQHYHQQQKMSNLSFNAGHRRTLSASLEVPAYQYHHQHHPYQHSYHLHNHANMMFGNNQRVPSPPIYYQSHHHNHHQQQQVPQQHPQYRRARAHTTSGYPPTMLFKQPTSHVSYNNQQIKNNNKNDQMMKETNNSQQQASQQHRYHCQHCKKSFSRPSSLRIHVYSHTGEKPYKCHHQGCGRSFSVHSNMRRHLRVHYYQPTFSNSLLVGQQNSSMRLPIVPPPSQTNICCNPSSGNNSSGNCSTGVTNVPSPLLHT